MNSIKRFQIENFQSHAKTIIVPALNGQLTVITGPSDAGKTVVLRALRWLLFNEPQGTDFIRVGASFARVTVELESGHTVMRERTRATNRYKIVAPGSDGPQVFEGFGNSVPLEVQEITGVRPVKIGDLELNLNLAEQLAGPFLGSSISAGARAKVLGKLAGTEEIDYAAKQLGTDLYRRHQDEKRLAGEVAELEEKLQEYDWLPAAKMKIEALESIVAKIKAAQERRVALVELKERLAEADEKITAAQAVLYCWRNLERAAEFAAEITENQLYKDVLLKLVGQYWSCEKSIGACEKIIAKYAGLPEAENLLMSAQGAAGKAKLLHNFKTSYLAGQEMIQKNQDILSRLKGIDLAGELAARVQEKVVRRDLLEKLARSYGRTKMNIVQEQVKLESLQQVAEADKLLQATGENRSRWEKLIILQDKYTNLAGFIEETRGKAVMWENRVAELEGAYHDLLRDAGVCPLCGQKIKSKIKEAV